MANDEASPIGRTSRLRGAKSRVFHLIEAMFEVAPGYPVPRIFCTDAVE
jgi:hypothetical protein